MTPPTLAEAAAALDVSLDYAEAKAIGLRAKVGKCLACRAPAWLLFGQIDGRDSYIGQYCGIHGRKAAA